MKNSILIIFFMQLTFIFSCCCDKKISSGIDEKQKLSDCKAACKSIPVSTTAPAISAGELEKGSYYGALDQKKKGTPDTWVHVLEGTRSASWVSPENLKSADCDCLKIK